MLSGLLSADLSRPALTQVQAAGLAALLAAILPSHRFYARKFAEADLSLSRLSFPRDLSQIPFTTKAELVVAQAEHPPHGELITYPFHRYTRMHQTSGSTTGKPLRWFDTPESWGVLLDCWEEKLALGGIGPHDRMFFPFSFGPFLGFWSAFEACARMGAMTLAGGGMSSSARLRFLLEMEATVVFATPTYALRLLEVAGQEGFDLARSGVRAVIVAGEPGGCVPATRARIEAGWGARVFDHNGMTETGPLGFECLESPGTLSLLETAVLPEIIDPDTSQPVPPGTPGELVITSFRRIACPLIRYRTGDIVCADPSPCPSGRALLRLDGGIRSRADDMVVIRGNNIHPATLQAILHRFQDVAEYLVEIDQSATLTTLRILVEPAPEVAGPALAERLTQGIRDELLFRAEVIAVPPGSLPRHEMKARRWVRKTSSNQPGDSP